jgi:hypothetical protein
MQFINWIRSFLAGALSHLANKLSTNKQLAITYNEPDNQEKEESKKEESLKVISCKVKKIKIKKKIEN